MIVQSAAKKAASSGGDHAHLADKPVLVHGLPLLATRRPRRLAPHLLHVLEHHVAVAVEGLDARQQLAVVAHRDEHLRVRAHGGLQDREGAGGELVLLELGDLVLASVRMSARLAVRAGMEEGVVRELVSRLGEEFSGGWLAAWMRGG